MADLVCDKHIKQYALDVARRERNGWHPTRVSEKFVMGVNSKVRKMIYDAVKKHRSVGKTIIDI